MARRVNLAAFKEAKNEENSIEIDADGIVFTVPAPECWPDEIGTLAAANDSVGMAQALLGDEYALFVEAGGSAALLGAIVAAEFGISAGE